MFLESLDRKMREGFLELAYNMANSNNDFDDVQKQMMIAYENETGLALDYEIKPLEVIFEKFEHADDKQKKSIYIEAIAVAMSNDLLEKKEAQLLQFLEGKWALSTDYRKQCEAVIRELNLVYKKLAQLF